MLACVVSLPAASSAVKKPLGMRSPVIGFVAEVANTLLQSCDASSTDCYCSELAELLDVCEEWQGSIEPQGAIHTLLQEQDGQLCGKHLFRVHETPSHNCTSRSHGWLASVLPYGCFADVIHAMVLKVSMC